MKIRSFTFNPFAENTYVLYDETGECAIVDPGCYDPDEKEALTACISEEGLKPVRLILTHCHIDHILGLPFIAETYGVQAEMHKGELQVLKYAQQMGMMYGTPVDRMPDPGPFLDDGDVVTFGNTSLEILFTPGHSPASICLFERTTKQLISGDVLFRDSIGRTDLPGGNYETLLKSIFSKLMILDDDVRVYPGHMETTTIGTERQWNPFLKDWIRQHPEYASR
jgi:glyoxylase-like metal-dependent hydrolase (beta-lactamase superfamily II)